MKYMRTLIVLTAWVLLQPLNAQDVSISADPCANPAEPPRTLIRVDWSKPVIAFHRIIVLTQNETIPPGSVIIDCDLYTATYALSLGGADIFGFSIVGGNHQYPTVPPSPRAFTFTGCTI